MGFMNLRQLEVFRAVMRCRTTVGAAEELGMSQSAVSNAIRHMEDRLGFALFERISNRLVPTDEARLLLEEAEPLFLHQRAVAERAADLKAGRAGRIRLVATAELSETLLPLVIPRFLVGRPGVHVSLDTRPLVSVLEAVETGLADIGVAMEADSRHGLEVKPVAELAAVAICRADDPLAALTVVTPTDLAQGPLVAPRPDNRIGLLIAEAFRRAGVPYQPAIDVRFLNVAARLVQEGCGATILDEITASASRFDALVVRPFQPDIRLRLQAVLPRGRALSRLAQDFLAVLETETRSRLAGLTGS
ncbi:LysR family transcriptional regulator [Xanthobacter flavus]|uniref:LysR family transcriptional regulator n=2 Tax=Xanthobacter TaxID=279 RepID=UPI001DA87DC6|nr:DNA-binding transcriptional LysR family regulator [Xanthobacter flavus]